MAVVVATIGLYILFTFKITEWRVAIRKRVNVRDTDVNQKAIDSLLNFETVRYFGAERREAARYDVAIEGYEREALKTNYSLAGLNFGQSLILTTSLISVLVMAVLDAQSGALTVGDFTMVNVYMMQITMPLNFHGTVYLEIRQAFTDMAEMFGLLDQNAEVKDAPDARDITVERGHVRFEDMRFS